MQCSISVFYRYDPWQLKCIPNNSRMLFKLTNRWKQIRFFTDGGFLFSDKPFNIKFNGKTYTKQLTKTSYTEKLCEEITFFSFCNLFIQELACDVKIEYWVDVRLYKTAQIIVLTYWQIIKERKRLCLIARLL